MNANTDVREARRQYYKAWCEAHREQLNARARRWREANPEKARAAQLRYWEKRARLEKEAGNSTETRREDEHEGVEIIQDRPATAR